VQREASDRVVAIGLRDPWLGDFYHHLLTLPWWAFLAGLALIYLKLNALFAGFYLLGSGAIANARPGSFADTFFFSVETISTIGYGQMSPATLYGNIVMTVEAMTGLTLLAVSAGLVLARFTRPTAHVMFSKVAVVTPFNGVPTLSFRLANERRNQILEAQVSVTLVRDERTAEGEWMRRFYDLQLGRQRSPILSGRGADYPTPPPQIPACGFPAPGSRQRSDAIVGLDATNPQARGFCDMPSPALSPEHALPLTYPFDRPPSLRHLRRRLRSALFDASTVLCSRPTPRLFLDSFVSSTSCRGPGSLKRLRARRGLPGSDAVLPYVMWPQTPAGRRFLA
jgi:hypothetical protein